MIVSELSNYDRLCGPQSLKYLPSVALLKICQPMVYSVREFRVVYESLGIIGN